VTSDSSRNKSGSTIGLATVATSVRVNSGITVMPKRDATIV
jgi:hypothetical protein